MARNRLILHVGAPKCGSSALQMALSRTPDFTSRSGERFRYVALAGDGELLAGQSLRRAAAASITRYAASINAADLQALEPATLDTIANSLCGMLRTSSIVLSCEGWLEAATDFGRLGILDRLEAPAEVIAYVRPQPEFLNASWWQWGAWSDIQFEVWMFFTDLARTCLWATMLEAWSEVSGVAAIRARPSAGDVTADFFGSIDCEAPPASRINRSLPTAALRFMQRHRALRPDAHASEIDFVLERALADWPGERPWVLPAEYVGYVIEQCRTDNERLLAMMEPVAREALRADARWWSPAAYAHRTVMPSLPPPSPPDAAETDALAAALAQALLQAERELAQLRAG